MLIQKPERIRSPLYRASARHRDCMARGPHEGDVVLCHINIAGNFGRGLKASDDHSVFLCQRCHHEFDTDPNRCEWLVRNVLLLQRELAFLDWEAGR